MIQENFGFAVKILDLVDKNFSLAKSMLNSLIRVVCLQIQACQILHLLPSIQNCWQPNFRFSLLNSKFYNQTQDSQRLSLWLCLPCGSSKPGCLYVQLERKLLHSNGKLVTVQSNSFVSLLVMQVDHISHLISYVATLLINTYGMQKL